MDVVVASAVAGAALAIGSVVLGVWLIAVRSRRPGPRQARIVSVAGGAALIIFGLVLAREVWAFWGRPII